jgi:hypothetical protein
MCTVCALLAGAAAAPAVAAQTAIAVPMPTGSPAPTSTPTLPIAPPGESFAQLVQGVLDESYGLLDADEKSIVDRQLEGLDATGAREVSSLALMLAATASSSEHMPVALAAAAAHHAPDDALVANNLGAMLRHVGRLDDSIIVLEYALELDPTSAAILTNLGNSYLDKGMDSDAQLAYSRALAFDEDFDSAHHGMAVLWTRRGNGQLAVEHLTKAARTGFVPSMRQVYIGARAQGGAVSKPFWDVIIDEPQSQDDGDPEGDTDSDALPQGDRLILPTLPKWNDRMALLASAPTYVPLAQQIMDKGLLGAFVFAMQYHADDLGGPFGGDDDWGDEDSWDDDESWGEEDYWDDDGDWQGDWDDDQGYDYGDSDDITLQGQPLKPIYQQKLFMLELVNDYYSGRIADELNRMAARRKEIDDRYERELEKLRQGGMMKNLERLIVSNKIYEAKALAQQVNRLGGQIADTHFYEWRDLTLSSYNRLKSVLQEYWRVSDEMTAGIYDQAVMDYVNQIRELTVYASLLPLALDLSTLPQAYALADYIAPISTEGEDLSQYRPQPMGEMVVPQKKAEECGLKGKVNFSLGPASFGVTCDSWELEFLAGVGGAYKRNFKTGETEISVLVGAKAGVGVGPASGELSAKGGLKFQFDADGNFAGWGDTGSLEAKAGIGPLSTGQSAEASGYVTGVSGPRVSTTPTVGFGG